MPSQERLHIGHLIKSVFDESGMTVAEFARRIHCARPNVYSIFERQDAGVEQLITISKALNYNFFDDILQKSGLITSSRTRHLDVHFDLEDCPAEKADQITTLLKEMIMKLNRMTNVNITNENVDCFDGYVFDTK